MGIRKTPISPEYGDPLWNLFRLSPNLSCSRLRLRLPSPPFSAGSSYVWPPPCATDWSLWGLSHALASFILTHWVPQGPVALAGDDTVEEHPGRKVFGKARHRDPVRSSHTFTAWRWGHKWVVLSILVQFPFA